MKSHISAPNNSTIAKGRGARTATATADQAKYALDVEKTLKKKIEASLREAITIELKDENLVITLSSGALDVVMYAINERFVQDGPNNSSDFHAEITTKKDAVGATESDCLKIFKGRKSSSTRKQSSYKRPSFTINVYRTTCRILVNGPELTYFVDHELPSIVSIIDFAKNSVQTRNEQWREACTVGLQKVSDEKVADAEPDDTDKEMLAICPPKEVLEEPTSPCNSNPPPDSPMQKAMGPESEKCEQLSGPGEEDAKSLMVGSKLILPDTSPLKDTCMANPTKDNSQPNPADCILQEEPLGRSDESTSNIPEQLSLPAPLPLITKSPKSPGWSK